VDATVYQLNFDGAERVMFFLRVGDQALRLLDREQREIRSTANYTLTRMTEAPLGGYTPINPGDPEVRAAAEYAVSEQRSRTGTAVALRRVARAERQVVAGLNYRLCLEVTVADKREEVQLIVYRNLQQRFSLAQWSSAGCASR
jgi:Aspartic acid proteinase inhibitor